MVICSSEPQFRRTSCGGWHAGLALRASLVPAGRGGLVL